MSKQITDRLLMIRPANFMFNRETSKDNVFQKEETSQPGDDISEQALEEFDGFVESLRSHHILVDVIEDSPEPVKPDSVFPNNWISLHEDGALITYPMFSPLRRAERREDIIQTLGRHYVINKRYAFEQFEDQGQHLEGTGSMVLDREHHIVYACLSSRTDIRLLDKFCVLRGYRKVVFQAFHQGEAIYHTNVLMALGDRFAVICLDCIPDTGERNALLASFNATGKEVIRISISQMEDYAGNMLQVSSIYARPFIVMSKRAHDALLPEQIARLQQYGEIIACPLDVIERVGGGSARCMIAENFLPVKP